MNNKVKSLGITIGSLVLIVVGVLCVSRDPQKIVQVAFGLVSFLIGFVSITLKIAKNSDEK
jgi:uncharacterized membrane protein YfcA